MQPKIFLRRLTYHLDTRNLLPEEQYGFRKGHGTIDQLLFFTQKVKDAQNRKPTDHTIAAFLDLTKTLDKEEWGAEATTLKLTYTSLMRPILDNGYQIYGTASETNLKSLERIQLNAARIITGLRNTCPNNIVLYEADIMPLKDRRSYNLPKYINKIKSYENKHRTFNCILNWKSNIRLKKEGPLHPAKRNGFLKYKVEKYYLAEKNISMQITNKIDELGQTDSGSLIKTTNGNEKMNRRNPYFCAVFRSELIAIYEALKSIRNTKHHDIWTLTDGRSAIQHLSHTRELRGKVSRNIIGYLQKLSIPQKFTFNGYPYMLSLKAMKLLMR
ncbi:hypothetical protein LAZ67_5002275 [Cordylochernes scorpioides]|uniref:Reverse transcriptase domain-containing protein n=1 Tax=Cordylochernes scorpioides TaxID=51811 RepID=A0ABY6KG98_9ARAC|nr:hypothetical protein LAZ67_5002275 [Cordylochernes scorpioides]